MVTFDEFSKLDLRVGKVLEVGLHPDAEKLYLLKIDIGERVVQLVAGIKHFYSSEELLGKYVVVLVNLKAKNIRGFLSEGMLLAAQAKDNVSIISPDKKVSLGSTVK